MIGDEIRFLAGRTRRVRHHLPAPRRLLVARLAALPLSPAERDLVAAMHPADVRHGLAVRERLRAAGETDPEVLLAALLHDAAKGEAATLLARTVDALARRHGPGVRERLGGLPGVERGLAALDAHEAEGGRLARAAGCSERVAGLIDGTTDDRDALARLRAADEADG